MLLQRLLFSHPALHPPSLHTLWFFFFIHLLFNAVNKQICHLLILVFANAPPPAVQPKLSVSQRIEDNAAANYPLLQGSFAFLVPG